MIFYIKIFNIKMLILYFLLTLMGIIYYISLLNDFFYIIPIILGIYNIYLIKKEIKYLKNEKE